MVKLNIVSRISFCLFGQSPPVLIIMKKDVGEEETL